MANMVRTNDAVVRSRECAPPLSWRRQRGLGALKLFVRLAGWRGRDEFRRGRVFRSPRRQGVFSVSKKARVR